MPFSFPKMFGPAVANGSKRHAEQQFPNESVGLVVNSRYVKLENVHPTPQSHFRVDPKALIPYHGRIQAVIHSHNVTKVNGQHVHGWSPSKSDMIAQLSWNIPFGIQWVTDQGAGNILWWGNGVPKVPLLGRPYYCGVYDCYGLIRDYYSENLSIDLPDFAREEAFWEAPDAPDLFGDNLPKNGFRKVTDGNYQPHDLIVLKIRSKIPNHILVLTGGNQVLHHLNGQLSKTDDGSRYVNQDSSLFDSVWRHEKCER